MAKIEIYSTPFCPFCIRAKQFLDRKGYQYIDIDVSNNPQLRKEMMDRSGGHTVPQIFINDTPVGGCDDMFLLAHEGELEDMINP